MESSSSLVEGFFHYTDRNELLNCDEVDRQIKTVKKYSSYITVRIEIHGYNEDSKRELSPAGKVRLSLNYIWLKLSSAIPGIEQPVNFMLF